MKRFSASHTPFSDMTPAELRAWLQQAQQQLRQKMERERVYLDRRATRGRHTPTDDAYEADQVLEQDMLQLLHALEHTIEEAGHAS